MQDDSLQLKVRTIIYLLQLGCYSVSLISIQYTASVQLVSKTMAK